MATPRIGRPRGRPKKPLPPLDVKPDLPEQAWSIIDIDLFCKHDRPASLGEVQRLLKEFRDISLTREAIRRWRLKPLYRRGYNWLYAQMLAEWMDWEDEGTERAARDLAEEVETRVRERMPQWIDARWPGAVRSMANGEVYTSPAAYADHLIKINRIPAELYDQVRAELAAEAERARLAT
jgi:hypothetical protein